MARVRPPTPRFQVGRTEQGQLVFPSTELIQTLEEIIQRTGGLGDVTLLGSLSAGNSTDNALARFDGTDGDRLQTSEVTVDDNGNMSVPSGATVDGRDVSVDGSKLDGIENGATADQTASEIKTLYESNSDTNAFTDSEESKLAGIEAGAEVNDVESVFGRTGNVTAQAGDYTTDQVAEASNLYYTDERVDDRVAALIVGGTNVTTSYDDGAGTLTLDASVPVDSVFGRTGAVTAQSGDYNTDLVTEAGNLYFSDARARTAVGSIYSEYLGTVGDDSTVSVTPPYTGGFMLVTTSAGADFPQSADSIMVYYDTGSSLGMTDCGLSGVGTSVDTTTGDLTGTTGTDGNITVSAKSGSIEIENRAGADRDFRVTFL
jgi:hypothetical protein